MLKKLHIQYCNQLKWLKIALTTGVFWGYEHRANNNNFKLPFRQNQLKDFSFIPFILICPTRSLAPFFAEYYTLKDCLETTILILANSTHASAWQNKRTDLDLMIQHFLLMTLVIKESCNLIDYRDKIKKPFQFIQTGLKCFYLIF